MSRLQKPPKKLQKNNRVDVSRLIPFLPHGFALCVILILGYLSFQYARITNFPIGDDPAIHIRNIEIYSYAKILTSTIYPLPLIIFKFFRELTLMDLPRLFTLQISAYLLFASLAAFLFARRVSNNWAVALATAIIFVTGRWVNDSLRIGLLAEVFSWAILLLSLYFFSKQKLPYALFFTILLSFSHPFASLVFLIIIILYAIITLLQGKQNEKIFIRKFFVSLAVLGLIAYLLKPDLIIKFFQFDFSSVLGWGGRSLWLILTTDSYLRLFIPFLALVGLITSVKDWSKPAVKLSYLLLAVGLFLSLNHLLGINLLTFRFYGYLEMGLAIFAGLGLSYLINQLQPLINNSTKKLPNKDLANKIVTGALLTSFSLIAIYPSYLTNLRTAQWQSHDPNAHAIMLPTDRAAISWIKNNTTKGAAFAAERRYAIWITALGDRPNITFTKTFYDESTFNQTIVNNKPIYQYLYFGQNQPIPSSANKYFHPVYSQNGINILEANQ